MRIKIVGVGGIGCRLLTLLPQFANFKFAQSFFYLIDGDKYGLENRDRQTFDELGNKAETTVKRMEKQGFNRIIFRAVPQFLVPGTIAEHITDGNIVFSGVDKHAVRLLISNHCQTLDNIVLFSGGNEYTDGNVQIYIRQDGKDVTLPIANEFHPEILHPDDRNPGEEVGCEVLHEREPQLLFMNGAIAQAMCNAFYAYLEGKLDYDEVFVDILTNTTRTVSRTRELMESKKR